MGKVIKNKRSLELVTSPSSGHETSSENFKFQIKNAIALELNSQYKPMHLLWKSRTNEAFDR